MCYLDECEFHEQTLVAALAVAQVALVHQFQCLIKEAGGTFLGLFLVFISLSLADFKQRKSLFVLGHQHVAYMLCQSVDEMSAVETLRDDIVEQYHDVADLVFNGEVDDIKIVLRIEYVQILNHLLVGDVPLTERGSLVEDGEGIAHTTVGFLRYHVERVLFVGDLLLFGHHLQVVDDIGNRHPLEVIDLTTGDDGGQNLMFLRGGENEDDVCRWFLKRLEEGIEGRSGEHVHLVDDEYLVASYLRRYACLLHQRLYLFHTIVGGGIQFKHIVGALFQEGLATLTFVAGIPVRGGMFTVDGFGKNAGTGGLSNSSGAAEKIGVCQFPAFHGVLQRGGQ